MKIIAAEDDIDLRKITPHVHFLASIVKNYRLVQDGDAVVFNGRSKDRYRLVVRLGGRPMLVLPETDLDHRLSRYLRVSIQLQHLAQGAVADRLAAFALIAKERISRAKDRAIKATKAKEMRGNP